MALNMPLTLGISPCPNDTFIFDAWINGRLGPSAPAIETRLEDINTLNHLALQNTLDIIKVSFFAYIKLCGHYQLLQAGGALGRGCGPLLVSRSAHLTKQDLAAGKLRVAVPGDLTTAHLLLRLYQPAAVPVISLPFDQIMPALAHGEIDAGVIIHEGRFTYHQYGLHVMIDLGAWWEETKRRWTNSKSRRTSSGDGKMTNKRWMKSRSTARFFRKSESNLRWMDVTRRET